MNLSLQLPYGLVREVRFHLAPGECLLLAGPNGCGKSTLLRALGRAGQAVSSEIHGHPRPCKGEGPADEVGGRGREATISEETTCPARCTLIPTGIPKVKGFTVEEFVRTGCYRESNWAGKLSADGERRLTEALTLLGLAEKRRQDISTLSDGEFQKACIAVGLTLHTGILLLDEPTAYLDVENRLMVLRTLGQVARETGTAVFFSSHDLPDALKVCHRVLAFTPDGRFLESAKENRLEVLQAAFPVLQGSDESLHLRHL